MSVGSLEAFWRDRRFKPRVSDSKELWHYWRERVSHDDEHVIVLLGTSRLKADISLDTLRARLPGYQLIQLAISEAQSSIGILRELVADPGFKGTVVCDIDTPLLARAHWDDHRDYSGYRPTSVRAYVDAIVFAWLSDRLIGLRGPFTLRPILVRLALRKPLPKPDIAHLTFRRESQWDFSLARDVEAVRSETTEAYRHKYQQRSFPPLDALLQDIAQVNAMVRRLNGRGGHVVFLRTPSTGERWTLEQQFHSKEGNWDRFVKLTDAVCIHFRDVAQMHALRCPDESHLDYRDSATFTEILATELLRRGVVQHTE